MSIDSVLGLLIPYGYWLVFAAILLDNAGLPIPGELVLLIFGALARNGDFNLAAGLLIASAAALGGDSVGYWLGRLTGDRMVRTYCRLTLGSGACVRRAVSYYGSHGSAAVITGRFVMGVRAFLPALAGSARMPFGRFLLFDSVGALVWSGAFTLIGYAFGWRLALVEEGVRSGSAVLLGVAGLGFGVYLVAKLLRRRRHGAASLRERAVARIVDALGLPRPVHGERIEDGIAGGSEQERASGTPAFSVEHDLPSTRRTIGKGLICKVFVEKQRVRRNFLLSVRFVKVPWR